MHHKRKNNTKFPKAKKFFIDIDRWGCGKRKRIDIEILRPKHKARGRAVASSVAS